MTFLLLYWKYFAAAAIVAALAIAYNVHVDKLVKAAVTTAVTERDNSWRDAEKKAIQKSEAEARAIETAHAKDLATIKTQAQKDISNAQIQRNKDVAAARSGALKLRDNAAVGASACNDSKAPSPASGSDGPKGADLSSAAVEFLLGLANDADAIVNQLIACQAVILSDRKGL